MKQRILILVFLILITAADFTYYAASDCLRQLPICFETDAQHMGNSQLAPFRYRVFEPFIVHALAPDGTQASIIFAVCIIQTILIAFTLPMLYFWLKRWMIPDRAMLGVCIFAMVEIAAYHFWMLSLGISIEVVCVLAALLLLDHWLWVIPILIIAALNRETAFFIVALYAAWQGRNGLKPSLVLLGIYIGITAALHVILGGALHELGVMGTFAYNLQNIRDALFANVLLLPLYLLMWLGLRSAPRQLRRLALVTGLYVAAIVVGASWSEILRLILPAMIILLPVLLGTQLEVRHLQPSK